MADGQLTPTQYEIMQVIWAAGREGASVGEVWKTIAEHRSVSRTTILNLIDRLEKRKWLKRQERPGRNRYLAAVTQPAASRGLAENFIKDFFSGSTSNLVMSLMGSKRLDADEIERLRQLLDSAEQTDRNS